MADEPRLDDLERRALCDLLDELGPDAPTLLPGWTTRDLAAHLVLRERDPVGGPCLVLPGPFGRVAERRQARLAGQPHGALVERVRSGPPPGFFRLRWVRELANLNELFVHHEDVRRANGGGPRADLGPRLEAALWRNAGRSGRHLTRRLGGVGLELAWAGRDERRTVRHGRPVVRLEGRPGELLLALFGRRDVAEVDLHGPGDAVAAVRVAHLGM